jgi:hypothetical protein
MKRNPPDGISAVRQAACSDRPGPKRF